MVPALGTVRLAEMPSALSTRLRATVLLFALLALSGLIAAGCGEPSAEEVQADKDAIQAFLAEYLPLMATAYRTGDTSPLEDYAAEKERASIEHRVRELARTGETLAPELQSVAVEDVTVWNSVNAYVTTHEIWHIRTFATGSENVVREQLDQANRVKYQLKRDGDRWRVYFRQLEQTFE